MPYSNSSEASQGMDHLPENTSFFIKLFHNLGLQNISPGNALSYIDHENGHTMRLLATTSKLNDNLYNISLFGSNGKLLADCILTAHEFVVVTMITTTSYEPIQDGSKFLIPQQRITATDNHLGSESEIVFLEGDEVVQVENNRLSQEACERLITALASIVDHAEVMNIGEMRKLGMKKYLRSE